MARLLVATADGVALCRRDGDSWTPESRALAGRRVTALATADGVTLAGTVDGVARSDDGGASWSALDEGLVERHVRTLALADGVALAGTEPAAIFALQPDGPWEERPEVARLRDEHGWWLPYSPRAGCVRCFARHGERVYAAVEVGGVLRSDDGGASWRLADGSSGQPDFDEPAAGAVHADVHAVYAQGASPELVHAATARGPYRSDDGGATWRRLRGGCYTRALWVDPAEPDHLLLGVADSVRDKNGRIEESVDGGARWLPASDGADAPWPEAMVERFRRLEDELVAVLSDGRLFARRDGQPAWRRILEELPAATDVAQLWRS